MLRKRKNRRYNETNDEEGDGERKFDLAEQIKSERFEEVREKHLQELPGEAITLRLIQKNGFEKPILVSKPDGLDLRVPPKSFLVRDVRNCVGHQRIIDVMDVKTQKNIEMSMKDWCKYYESKNRDRLLNVISLEFSHTKLDELVESPMIVKLLDWVDLVWPKFLKESQTESTNTIDKMKYPKVQKYCLMSVKGSYTDFHIDFGGTSVWYHILRGKKIFWMVPPTELNLQIFEEWTLSGMQQDVFFGDTVEECFRVEICAGNTFFIPSGWIHAVYTLEDSLVFGGNFLHSFGIENQLKVSRIEDATKVPVKFRYPFYTEILWYVVQHYVYCLTNKDHLHKHDVATVAQVTPAAATSSPTTAIESNKKNKTNSIEIEDETTESEQESDTTTTTTTTSPRKRKAGSAASKRQQKRGRYPQKSAPKKTNKKQQKPPITDDESTDIDSANEELVNTTTKPTTNTCRMTKNSLLRLQYEVVEDQQRQQQSSNKSNKLDKSDSSSPGKSPTKKKQKAAESPSSSQNMPLNQQQQQQTSSTLNLAEIVLSHESKLNGWAGGGVGSGGGQSTWSNPNNSDSNEPKRIHITRFELNGLKVLVKYLSKLSGAKKNLPNLIRNSRALLDDCRKLIIEHENDDPEKAVTGKPITPELLNPKKTDMNELIGQFFKPTEITGNDESSPSSSHHHYVSSSLSSSNTHHGIKSKAEASSQQRLSKSNQHSDGALKGDEKRTSSATNDSALSSKSSSPHKETKCLSPNKKLLSNPASATAASPPPRPKSPPTRPLSNNQYTSKTKNNNNLLLPGSFADLIAATSTEKKVFDVTGTDVTSSLFAVKDLGSTKTASTSSSPTKSSSHNKEKLQDKPTSSGPITPKSKLSSSSSYDITSLVATSTGAGTGISTINKDTANKTPNSPEPPKAPVQKRFITPNVRPVNKEKLIYASAPYISPVHASEQSRSTHPYPWQTPAQPQTQQQQPHPPQQNPPTYSPTTPRPIHSSPSSSSAAPAASGHQPQAPYTPDPRALNQGHHVTIQNRQHHQQESQSIKQQSSTQSADNLPQVDSVNHRHHEANSGNKDSTQVNIIVKSYQQQQQQQVTPSKDESKSSSSNTTSTSVKNSVATKEASVSVIKSTPIVSVKVEASPIPAPVAHNDKTAKKPATAKPRGPPKKSKEARQAIESVIVEPPMPTSVIKAGPSSQPSLMVSSAQPAQKAAKTKRQKKQKDVESPAAQQQQTPRIATNQQVRPQTQPSVICGLVTPPTTSATGAKINPQSYLISRPLLFNTMPTFSAAQFQQLPRSSSGMPLLTAPMGSPLGLPLQQGARLVWATRPPPAGLATSGTNINVSLASSSTAQPLATHSTAKTTTTPRLPVTSAHSDNAALLSLATTALSTAPMVSSPALSQLSNRAPAPQAIMVSSANQPGLFAGQQFFRPFVQRMPMTHYVAQQQPGGPRPARQLLFALPNQGQPRYLITQPGFMQQRFQAPHVVTNQPTPTLAYATFKPTPADSSKAMKTKKVKTS